MMRRYKSLTDLYGAIASGHSVGVLSAAMFAGLFAATLGVWLLARANIADKAQTEFAASAEKIADAMQERLTDYEEALLGAAGLVSAVPTLTREQWQAYVSPLSVRQRLPGVQSVAFTKRVTPQEKEAHIAAVRAEGFPGYTIWPDGAREEYTAITFSEPSDPANQRALGYDMFAEPVRHAAMAEARDTGLPVLSGKVKLVQQTGSDEQPGFLIFVPVYRNNTPADTTEQRRAALLGYVFSPFRARDFIGAALQHTPETMGVEVYDGTTIDKGALLYRSPSLAAFADPTATFGDAQVTQRALGHHRWTLRLVGLPGYAPTASQSEAWIILAAGLILSLIAAAVVNSLAGSRKRAQQLNHQLETDIALRRDVEQRLRTAEDTLRDAVDSISEAFVIFDAEDRLVLCNEAFRRLYPASADILKPGVTFEDILRDGLEQGVHIDAKGREEEWLADRLRGHAHPSGAIETPLGDGRWALVRDRRMRNGGIAGLRIDITQLKKIETQLREMKEAAEAANVAKSQFLANMSHELRTPLNAIIGFSELIEKFASKTTPEKCQEYAQYICTSGRHLLDIISDILDLSKIENGRLTLHEERIDVATAIKFVIDMVQERMAATHQTLVVEVPSDLPALLADERLVKQALLNLLSNAVKFAGDEGMITVGAEIDSRGVFAIWVEDTGIGIAPQDLARICQPFVQIESTLSRQHQGTGLGLALTKSILELHDGALEIASQVGHGTSAKLCFPASRVLGRAAEKIAAFV